MPLNQRSFVFIFAAFALFSPTGVQAGQEGAAKIRPTLKAVRIDAPIRVDGNLDEEAWLTAPVASGFRQSEPREGEPATEETDVRVLYDQSNLYLGVYAHESQPDDILVSELKKDFDIGLSDVVEVVLDTFHDERNGYLFATNAMGAKWDAQMVNEGRDVNANWDGIWNVETQVTDGGWYAEIAIPFRTLRFADSDVQSWGINFLRRLRHKNEDSYWAPLPRIYQIERVSLAGTLEGLRSVRPGADLRLKPYVLSSGHRVAAGPTDGDVDGGFDAKYGVTSGLTWDFTVNTDFSQVEADEQQVNLTRFSLFFPEKRDFFLENSGVFQFGQSARGGGGRVGGGGGGGGRTNGLQDEVLFFSRRIGLSETGDAIPLLAGTRLTGRAGQYTIGAMNIQQRRGADIDPTNFTAARLRRNILANSDLGVMFLNKDAKGGGFNRFAGADVNLRFFENLNVYGFVARTFSPEPSESSDGTEVMARAGLAYRGERLDGRFAYTTTGTRFDDEMGFVPRVGIDKAEGQIGGHFRPLAVSSWLREIFPHYQVVNITRPGRVFDSRYIDYHLPFNFQNSAFIETGVNANTEVLIEPFTINSRRHVTITPGRYNYNEYFVTANSDRSARLSLDGRFGTGPFYDGDKTAYSLGAQVRANARLTGRLSWSRNVIDLATGSYTTDLVSGRINYGFTTKIFLNALLQYNTDAQQWSSNIRFNIIHRPLSDIFIVYNDRYDSDTGALQDRALIAKLTYLLAF